MFLTANMAGAFTSYQSFFVKGSTLGGKKGKRWEGKGGKGDEQFAQHAPTVCPLRTIHKYPFKTLLLNFQHVSDNTTSLTIHPNPPNRGCKD